MGENWPVTSNEESKIQNPQEQGFKKKIKNFMLGN